MDVVVNEDFGGTHRGDDRRDVQRTELSRKVKKFAEHHRLSLIRSIGFYMEYYPVKVFTPNKTAETNF